MSSTKDVKPLDLDRRRAFVRKLLSAEPNDTRLLAALRLLLTPMHIQTAARAGVLLLSHHTYEPQMRLLAAHLQKLGLSVDVSFTGVARGLTPNAAQVGVLILVIGSQFDRDHDMQHCYGIAMTLGKVVVPVLLQNAKLPDLFFDLTPLWCGDNLTALVERLSALLVASVG
jgi:hypothetical protein